jgi:hypothetical protein
MLAHYRSGVMCIMVQVSCAFRPILHRYTDKRVYRSYYVRYEEGPWCLTPPFPFPTFT